MKSSYLALGLAIAGATPAAAQTVASLLGSNFGLAYNRGGNVSVLDRARPDYDPIGLPVGAFRLFPSVSTQLEYVDNVYASQNNHASDGIFTITPGFTLLSNWSRNAVSLTADVSQSEYFSLSNNDTTNYSIRMNGRLDLLERDTIVASYAHDYGTEPRTSSLVAQESPDPSRFTHDGISVSGVHQLDRLRLLATFTYNKIDYQNLSDFLGQPIQNDLRNNTQYQAIGRADYAISQDFALFTSVEYNRREFQLDPVAQNTDGYLALGGINLDIPQLVRGEVGLGYLIQDYTRGGNQNGFAAQTQIQYFPTRLTTLTFNAQRQSQNSTLINSSDDIATDVGLRVDHELLRNVLLFARAGYHHDEYQGFTLRDSRYTFDAGATYLVNRLISVNLAYDHTTQNTVGVASTLPITASGNLSYPYSINSVYIGLTLHR